MSRHTTFRIGGPADYFVTPHTKEEIRQVIQLCKAESLPFAVLGNGSNLLVGDKGFRGVVIQLFKNFSDITIEEEDIYAQSGALLVRLANQAAKQGLTGLEFASGIPGTRYLSGSRLLQQPGEHRKSLHPESPEPLFPGKALLHRRYGLV